MQVPFDDAFVCSYLSVTYAMNDSSTITVYGWIDNVKQISDYPNENVRIDFHLDYWRTYISQVTLTNGMVKRRVANGTEPPQGYPYKYKYVESVTPLITPTDNIWWVYLSCTPQNTDGETAYTYECCFPVSVTDWTTRLYVNDFNGTARHAPSGGSLAIGAWDEQLGIAPSIIQGIWILPVPPKSYTGTGTISDPIILSNISGNNPWILHQFDSSAPSYCYRIFNTYPGDAFTENTVSFSTAGLGTTDTSSYAVTDFNGQIVTTLPWGVTVTSLKYRVVMSSISCNLQIRFDDINSSAEGVIATIPGMRVETTDNSWSDYVYSGERTTEINSRNLSNQMALYSGIAGSVSSAAQGAMLGAIGGSAGAMAGLGALTSIAGTAASYAVSSYYAPKLQEVSDTSHALQLDGMLLPGSGFDFLAYGRNISLIKLTWDTYSITQRANDISLNGANVSEPTANCQPLLTAGGPLQIADVTVLGNVPNIAKSYIRARLNNGVRII